MAPRYTEAENIAWFNANPPKRVGAVLALFNPAGQLLLVQPNYRPSPGLVGGVVDEGESPLAAALRETEEEIGLKLTAERLSFAGLSYQSPQGERKDAMLVYFVAHLTDAEIAAITLQESELDSHAFVNLDDPSLKEGRGSVRSVVSLARDGAPAGYFEWGQLAVPARLQDAFKL